MALHGVNPRTGIASTVIGNNHYDEAVTQTVAFSTANPAPDANIEAAVTQIQAADYGVTGLIMDPSFASALANEKSKQCEIIP